MAASAWLGGVLLMAGAAWQAAPAPADVCRLLDAQDIRTVQEATLHDRKGSDQESKSLRFRQCVFAATDVTRSVSLTVISGPGDGARQYFASTFRPPRSDAALARATRKKDLPRQIAALGEDAYWTGDTRAGALYVLTGGLVIRISVGGVRDEDERLRRSRALAEAVLARLRAA